MNQSEKVPPLTKTQHQKNCKLAEIKHLINKHLVYYSEQIIHTPADVTEEIIKVMILWIISQNWI